MTAFPIIRKNNDEGQEYYRDKEVEKTNDKSIANKGTTSANTKTTRSRHRRRHHRRHRHRRRRR